MSSTGARAGSKPVIVEAAEPSGRDLGPAPTPKRRSFATYEKALAYLERRPNVERTKPRHVEPDAFKLDRMRMLARALGEPQQGVKFVHVAGSKGKGSTVEMLASALNAHGYVTGVFTSPHLVDVRERVRIAGEQITEDDFRRLMARVAGAASAIAPKFGEPTYFEIVTALALLHFQEQAVDVAVLETGLGGRLDCTNIVAPEVVLLTSIQLEHTAILGDSLEAIAGEKAGIMKAGVPAVTGKQAPEVMDVFRARAEEIGCPLMVLGEDVDFTARFEATPELGPHVRVGLTSPRVSLEHLAVPLPGEHQGENCGLALAALDQLVEKGFAFTEIGVAEGLAKTPSHGRLERVWDRPRIYVDGAHNPESIKALVKSIGATITYDSMVMVFGCAADKDVDGMLREVELGADKVVLTRSEANPRAMEPAELARRFDEISVKMCQTEPSVKEAINTAARAVGRDDLIVVTGSFLMAGEAKKLLDAKKSESAG